MAGPPAGMRAMPSVACITCMPTPILGNVGTCVWGVVALGLGPAGAPCSLAVAYSGDERLLPNAHGRNVGRRRLPPPAGRSACRCTTPIGTYVTGAAWDVNLAWLLAVHHERRSSSVYRPCPCRRRQSSRRHRWPLTMNRKGGAGRGASGST